LTRPANSASIEGPDVRKAIRGDRPKHLKASAGCGSRAENVAAILRFRSPELDRFRADKGVGVVW